jgi:hypothetical protein
LRQLLLVVVLVAASFLGGVFVNGPGLRWAQAQVLRSFGLGDASEIASVDLPAAANPEPIANGSGPAQPVTAMTQGSLDRMSKAGAPDEHPERRASDRRASAPARAQVEEATLGSPPPQLPSPSGMSPLAAAKPASVARASLAQDVTAAGARSVPARKSPATDSAVAPVASDSPGPRAPSTARAASSAVPSFQSSAAQMSVMDRGDEWAALERKMQALGVSRFVIEGQPGDRVTFSCLIPLAGSHAVAQRFEAEGDDLIQVTHAALRRITLWQATGAQSR